MSRQYKKINCDRNGRPIKPKDAPWQDGVLRGVIFAPIGAALIPIGLMLYSAYPNILVGMIIFFGAFFVLVGAAMIIIALTLRAKMPDKATIMSKAKTEGELVYVTVNRVKTKTVKNGAQGVTLYKVYAEYPDKDYGFTRKFVSYYQAENAAIGDRVPVYYYPDSNIGYYIDVSGKKVAK